MVRAILEGRKTQTRRVVKGCALGSLMMKKAPEVVIEEYAPYLVNDILYVRETWHKYIKRVGRGEACHLQEFYGYKASVRNSEDASEKWKPSIHMPKEAARLFLRVKSVKIDRLHNMDMFDYFAEGVEERFYSPDFDGVLENEFARIWDSTIKKDDLSHFRYNANPYVWVIEFELLPCSSIAEVEKLEV